MRLEKGFSRGRVRLWLIEVICVLLLIASCFFAWVIHSDYKNNYKQIQQQYYRLICGQIVQNMESAIRYGKDIERFYGMDTVFQDMYQYVSPTISAYILNKDGSLLYSADSRGISRNVLTSALIRNNLIEGAGDKAVFTDTLDDGSDVMLFPIQKPDRSLAGGLVLVISGEEYREAFDTELRNTVRTTFIVALATMLAAVLLIALYPSIEQEGSRRRLLGLVLTLTIVSMAVQGTAGYLNLQRQYKSSMVECGNNISEYIGNLVERVHEKGIAYEDMEGLSDFLAARVNQTSLIWSMKVITVIGDSDEMLAKEGQSTYKINLHNTGGRTRQLQFELSESYMSEELMKLLLTFLSTAIVMMAAITEINRLPVILLQRKDPARKGKAQNAAINPAALRLASFMVYMGNYTCMPFTAVLIRERGLALGSLSVTATAALPITVECIGVIIGLFILNKIGHRLSSRLLLFATTGMLVALNLLCIVPGTAAYLIGIRALCGLGGATLKTTLNRFTAFGGDSADISGNVAGINAGILGGIMCGGSLGAIISSVASVYATYAVAAAIIAAFLPLTLLTTGPEALSDRGGERRSGGGFFTLIRDRHVLLYLILVQIPLNVGLMFIVAFFPTFMEASGKSILTSYGYIVNGLAGIYIGPFMARALSRRLGNRNSLALVMGIGAVAIFILGFNRILSITAMLSAILMGIFDEYGNPIASDYFLQIPAVKEMGASEALGYMSIVALLAQSISPVLYGRLISGISARSGIAALIPIAAVCIADAVLILLFLKERKSDLLVQK